MKVEIVTLLANGLITPHIVDGGQSAQAFAYRVTNAGADRIKISQITIPAGFTYTSLGAVTATGGKSWSAAYSGGVVTLTATSSGDYIANAEYAQVIINAATQAVYQAATAWPAVVTGENNKIVSATESIAGDMKVEIIPLSATAVATPHIVDGGQASIAVTYKITNSNTDTVKRVQITIPAGFTYVFTGAITATGGKIWTASQAGGVITLTPQSITDYIGNTQFVEVIINVATQSAAQAPIVWPVTVTGNYNGTASATEVTGGDMQVEIKSLLANGLLTPRQVYNSSAVAITCRVANAGTDDIKLTKITIPSGFTFTSLGSVSASAGKNWTAACSGTVITLAATTGGDYISNSQYVQIIVNVTTQATAQGLTIWPITVTGNLNGTASATEAVTNDMRVQIVTLSARGLATPHAVNSNQNVTVAYRTTNAGTDRLKKIQITVPAGFSSITTGLVTVSGGKIWTASITAADITLNAATINDFISIAEYVEVAVGVTTQAFALPSTTWPSVVTGENGNTSSSTEVLADDMKVAIVDLAANGLVTPHLVYNSQASVAITYKITSCKSEKIKSAAITIPGGFTYVSSGTPSASGSKNWTAVYAGGVVTLSAVLAADYLDNTEYVQIVINVATQAGTLAATTWPGIVTGVSNTVMGISEAAAGDMQVEIRSLSATALITPHVVPVAQASVPLTYLITNTGNDSLKKIFITIPTGFTYVSLSSLTISGSKSWSGACAGGIVTIQANSSADNIITAETVQIVINVATQSLNQAPITWPVTVTGYADGTASGTEAVAGDMQVQISTLAATALVTPHQVYNSQTVAITYRVTSANSCRIKQAKISIPSGFTYASLGLISASGAKVWTGSYSGGDLTLSASSSSNYIDNTEYVEVIVNITTQAAVLPATVWPALVTGESNNTESATETLPGNMMVEIFSLSATGLITPHLVVGQSLVPFTYKVTNTSIGNESLKIIQITIPAGFTYASAGTISASGAKIWTSSYAGGVLTLTPLNANNYIVTNEYVQVVINASTISAIQAATDWPSTVTGSLDGTASAKEAAIGDMKVAITMLSASAVITPHSVNSSLATQMMKYTITNTNVERIANINIIIPIGFSYVSLGTLTVTGSKTWSTAFYGGVITLNAQTTGDSLNTGENISVPIMVSTQAAGLAPTTWPVILAGYVSGTFSATEAVSGDMKVNIAAYTLTITSDSTVILPSGTITVKGNLLDINAAPKSGANINYIILSGDAVITSLTSLTTDLSGNTYLTVKMGPTGGKVTVRGIYGVNNITDAVFEVITTTPSLAAKNLSYESNGIIYAKAVTKFALQGVNGVTLEYKIDDGIWQAYTVEFSVASLGLHTIYYRYSDPNGSKGMSGSVRIYITPLDTKFVNYPNPFAAGKDTTRLEYILNEDAQVKAEIFNLLGELVWSKEVSSGQPGGKAGINNDFIWDGKNNMGVVVANGGYICRITAVGADSTTTQIRKIGVIK